MKIKAIETKNYIIELHNEKDYYIIKWSKGDGKDNTSERLYDYKNSDFLFDLKLLELEGQ